MVVEEVAIVSPTQVGWMHSASLAPRTNRMDTLRFSNNSFDSAPQLNVGTDPEELNVDAGLEEPAGDGRCGSSFACRKLDRDVHAIAEDDGKIANMQADAEKFDPRAEGD